MLIPLTPKNITFTGFLLEIGVLKAKPRWPRSRSRFARLPEYVQQKPFPFVRIVHLFAA